MTNDEADKLIDQMLEEHLPDWAIKQSSGALELGAQLPTKDGRRTGNAHIIHIGPWPRGGYEGLLYTVLTDAGSTFRVTEGELHSLFHPPQWVSDVEEVKKRFNKPQ